MTPLRVTLPDGRSFLARYERISRKNLPANVTKKRPRTIGPRRQRKCRRKQGAGILRSVFNLGKSLLTSSVLRKVFDIGSSAVNSVIAKKKKIIIDEGIKHASKLYNYGTKKTKTKKKLKKSTRIGHCKLRCK